MATIDLLILIPILISAFNGYRKGLLIEVFGIGAFILAIIVSFKFLHTGASFLEGFIETETIKSISPYLSFILVFMGTVFLIKKFGWLMRKAIRLTFLGTLDGILGASLGAFTGLFGVSVLLWLIAKTSFSLPQDWLVDNKFYDFSVAFAPAVISKVLDWIPLGGNWVEYLDILKDKFSVIDKLKEI